MERRQRPPIPSLQSLLRLVCAATSLLVLVSGSQCLGLESEGSAVSGAACVARGERREEPRYEEVSPGVLSWQARAGEEVECRWPGFEPRLVACERGSCADGERVRVALQPAREVALRGVAAATDVVEIRNPDPERPELSGRSELVYETEIRALGGAGLAISRRGRLLRFLREGRSPRSVWVPPGAKSLPRTLAAPAVGGELVLRLAEGVRVPPARFQVLREGWIGRFPIVEGRWLFAAGLAPGTYRFAPEYEGGVLGPWQEARVADGEATERLVLALPAVGGLAIDVEAELCGEAPERSQLRVARRTESERETSVEDIWREPIVSASCRATVAGLSPGRYHVELVSPEGDSLAHEAVEVPEEIVEVWLSRGAAVLAGRVTSRDGEPVPDLWVVLSASSGISEVSARTDERGEYLLETAPGTYTLRVGGSRYSMARFLPAELKVGTQRRDLVIEAGAIEVRITKIDGSSLEKVVQLDLTAKGLPRIGLPVFPEDGDTVLVPDLFVPASYELDASSSDGWSTSEPVHVELTEDDPHGFAELRLSRRDVEVRLVDQRGAPVAGARVLFGHAMAKEVAPGRYRPPFPKTGAKIYVDAGPGLAPACREASAENVQLIELVAAPHAAWVQLPSPSPPRWITLRGLPGSTCAINLEARSDRVRPQGGWLEIRGLPAGVFVLELEGGAPLELVAPTPPPADLGSN